MIMNEEITLKPVAFVKNNRKDKSDDNWGKIISEIELVDDLPSESFDGIETFSHLEILYFLHKADKTITGSEYPRENPKWTKVGIFAQRKKDRPNHIGLTIVKLIKKEGRKLIVANLDAIDGTPILDIKPVFKEYLPKDEIKQPAWTKELMKNYWKFNKTDNIKHKKREDFELPVAIKDWGWKFHHIGIPTSEKKPDEKYIKHLKFYVSGFDKSPFGIEWIRFEKDSSLSDLVQKYPHIAFEVDDIESELKKRNFNIITPVNSPSKGVKVAMIEHNGAPVELIEFSAVRDKT